MKFEEIAENAFKNTYPTEHKLNLAEKYTYLQLVNLYKDYKNALISKEDAAKNKTKIQKEFEENQRKIDEFYEYLKERSKARDKYFEYIAAIEKSKSQDDILDNSLKFIEQIIADSSFYYRQMKKIDNEEDI